MEKIDTDYKRDYRLFKMRELREWEVAPLSEKDDGLGTVQYLGPVQTPYFTWAESNSNLGRPKLI